MCTICEQLPAVERPWITITVSGTGSAFIHVGTYSRRAFTSLAGLDLERSEGGDQAREITVTAESFCPDCV